MVSEITRIERRGNIVRKYKKYKCLFCGNEFEARYDLKRKYCSHKCSELARRKDGKRINGQHAFPHKCELCGKEYWNLKTKSRYCSAECQHNARLGEEHPLYKNGCYIDKYKYILNESGGYVSEHRKMVESVLGRKLDRYEDIHHINEDKLDNRLENLALLSRADHTRIHHYLRGNGKMTESEYQGIIETGKRRILENCNG